jgi:ABC-type Zn uptake system ZnuABC Zn-binding protein ZnuA
MYRKFFTATAALLTSVVALSGCATNFNDSITVAENSDASSEKLSVVVGSTIVASLVDDIAGDTVSITSLVPNSFDAHTYELKPSEAAAIETADVIFLADKELNANVAALTESRSRKSTEIIDLNQQTLEEKDFLYYDAYQQRGKNPHTWTNLRYTWRWVSVIRDKLSSLNPSQAEQYTARSTDLQNAINDLHNELLETFRTIPKQERKIVVYHDAWEYFGKEYGIEVVGTLQAIDYGDPSPQQLASIIEQINSTGVDVFYGSEVFPSDVLTRISEETDAEYISDLSDDALPAPVGERSYLYLELMQQNFDLIKKGMK